MNGGLLTDPEVIACFFQPDRGKTALTLVSKRSGARFTYEIARKKPRPDGTADEVWYVDLLIGSNNESDYAPLAVVTKRDGRLRYHQASRSAIGYDAPSAQAYRWALEAVQARDATRLAQLECWHEGACGKCGRRLTTNTSIARGLGPICSGQEE